MRNDHRTIPHPHSAPRHQQKEPRGELQGAGENKGSTDLLSHCANPRLKH